MSDRDATLSASESCGGVEAMEEGKKVGGTPRATLYFRLLTPLSPNKPLNIAVRGKLLDR